MLSLLCFIPNLVFCVRFFFFSVSGFARLSTCAFILIAEAMTRGAWHHCLPVVFDPPVPGADLSNSDGDAGPTEGLPPPSPPLPSGPQFPSRVAGGPLGSLELGAQGSLLPAAPLPPPPPRVLCQEAPGEPSLHQDRAGSPQGCFWKQLLPPGLFSLPGGRAGRPTACVPWAVCRFGRPAGAHGQPPRGSVSAGPRISAASTRGPGSAASRRPPTWFSRTRLLVFLPLEAANLRAL